MRSDDTRERVGVKSIYQILTPAATANRYLEEQAHRRYHAGTPPTATLEPPMPGVVLRSSMADW